MSPVSCIVRDKGENIGLIIDGLKEGLWQERYENGQLKYRKTYTKGSVDMKVVEAWWENGQLKEKFFKGIHPLYKPSVKSDILPEYLMISWNENGNLYYICPLLFQNDKYLTHGVVIDYYENGQKFQETTYINDLKTFPIRAWNENGRIYGEINNEGYVKEWHDNGQLSIEAFYNKELEYIGLYKEWNENGKILKDGKYVNGKFISKRKPKRKRPSKMDSKMTKANYIDFFNQQFKNLLRFFPHDDDLNVKHDLKIEIK
jgi:antitoxin component YwqK of YwqJK toxin-antitoxin module